MLLFLCNIMLCQGILIPITWNDRCPTHNEIGKLQNKNHSINWQNQNRMQLKFENRKMNDNNDNSHKSSDSNRNIKEFKEKK